MPVPLRLDEGMSSDHRAHVVAVQGVGGGAGASVLAAALGVRAAARHRSVCLVDLDDLTGALDVLLGAETVPGLRWPDLAGAVGEIVAASVRDRLPTLGVDGPRILAHGLRRPPMPGDLPHRVVCALRRGFDLVVLDLPARARPPCPVDDHLLVLRARAAAVAAATACCHRIEADTGTARDPRHAVPRLVVRDGRGAASASIARALDRPLALALRSDSTLARDLERGAPPGSRRRTHLARAADHLLDATEEP